MNISGKLRHFWPEGEELILVQQMDEAYFPRSWNLNQWKELEAIQYCFFSWMDRNRLLGFALFAHLEGDETAHLLKICVTPEKRGSGEAHCFWKEMVRELRLRRVSDVFLEVEEENIVARFFYAKVGFLTLRTVKGYYSDGKNGIMMSLTL